MYSAGQYEEAIRKYMFSARKSRETHQTDGEMKAWCNISLSYLKLNKPGEAIEFAEKAVRLDSRNAKVSILFQIQIVWCSGQGHRVVLPSDVAYA